MNSHRFNISIRNAVGYTALATAASLAVMFVFSSVAQSKEVKIDGLHRRAAVYAACDAVGGTKWSTGNRYGCSNDKKGTSVTCTNGGECTGEVPGRTMPDDSPLHVLAGSSGLAATGEGIFGAGAGMGSTGPSATGSPAGTGGRAPAAAPIQLR
jgi:hypothetical protein